MRSVRVVFLLAALGGAVPALAQGQRGRLMVTVADTTAAVIPDAQVTVVALDDAAKDATIPPVQTSPEGVASFSNLTPGRYSIVAEFAGFEMGLLRDVPVRGGDNRRVVVLKSQEMSETVTVGQEGQEAASNRASATFGVKLSDDQLDGLSDDPEELARQLKEMAGPNAIIRVDSFEGMQLPPKSQIKSVHVTRDNSRPRVRTRGILSSRSSRRRASVRFVEASTPASARAGSAREIRLPRRRAPTTTSASAST